MFFNRCILVVSFDFFTALKIIKFITGGDLPKKKMTSCVKYLVPVYACSILIYGYMLNNAK